MDVFGDNDYFWIVVVVAIIVVGVVGRYIYERRRSEAMEAEARGLGLSFEKSSDIDVERRFGSFDLFSEGYRKRIKNCVSGRLDGADVMVFGYSYATGGKNSTTRRQSVICFESDKIALPEFELRPEGFFHKIAGVFGYQDIDFSSNPDFSKNYLLRGTNETAIRDAFSPNVIAHFERHKDLCVEVKGRTLICYRQSTRVRPADIKDFLDEGRAVFRLLVR